MSVLPRPGLSLDPRLHVAVSSRPPALSTTTSPSTSSSSASTSTTPSSRAGASLMSSSAPRPTPTPNSVRKSAPTAAQTSAAPPSQSINEKVKAAIETDLELAHISPSIPIVLTPTSPLSPYSQRSPSRSRNQALGGPSSHAHMRARSRSRGRTEQTQVSSPTTTINSEREWDEKRGLRDHGSGSPIDAQRRLASPPTRSSSLTPASFTRPSFPNASSVGGASAAPPPYSTLPPNYASSYSSSVRRMLLAERIRPWLPFLAYAATTLGFVFAITFWREEVFGNLDELAIWLRGEGTTGYAVMFFMIFLTCIPPMPLYSTLQVLSGYTFGPWTGGVVSYFSALAGAIFVFSMSRSIPALRSSITGCMSHSRALQRVVRAISKRPSLLFLVRLAPYPYNVLNALLAGCPRLTFRTYFTCTALSLLKVIVHTSIGAGISNFAAYHAPPSKSGDSATSTTEDESSYIRRMSSIFGIALCIALAIYLSFVARRAVDEELDDDDDDDGCDLESAGVARGRSLGRIVLPRGSRASSAERAAFLSSSAYGDDDPASSTSALGSDFSAAGGPGSGSEMTEREGATRQFACASPVPLSSLSCTPYGPHEWSR